MEGIKKAGDKKLLQMMPEGTIKKIEDVTKAYAEYAKEMTSVIAAEKALEAAIQKKSEAEQKVTST
jgi:hypothetical protein